MTPSSSPERDRERRRRGGRLAALAELVPPGSRVADIGSGHGLLPRLLLASRRAPHCIATERCAARLARVRVWPAGHPLSHRLELRHGEGLAPLSPADRIQVVVLAGLGGRTIARLLARARHGPPLGIGRYVLQPQTPARWIRAWLIEHGLSIAAESIAAERGRFYEVIAAETGPPAPPRHPVLSTEELLAVGPRLARSRDPLVRLLWEKRLREQERILLRVPSTDWRERARGEARLARRILSALP